MPAFKRVIFQVLLFVFLLSVISTGLSALLALADDNGWREITIDSFPVEEDENGNIYPNIYLLFISGDGSTVLYRICDRDRACKVYRAEIDKIASGTGSPVEIPSFWNVCEDDNTSWAVTRNTTDCTGRKIMMDCPYGPKGPYLHDALTGVNALITTGNVRCDLDYYFYPMSGNGRYFFSFGCEKAEPHWLCGGIWRFPLDGRAGAITLFNDLPENPPYYRDLEDADFSGDKLLIRHAIVTDPPVFKHIVSNGSNYITLEPTGPGSAALSPDGKWVAYPGPGNDRIVVADANTGQVSQEIPLPQEVLPYEGIGEYDQLDILQVSFGAEWFLILMSDHRYHDYCNLPWLISRDLSTVIRLSDGCLGLYDVIPSISYDGRRIAYAFVEFPDDFDHIYCDNPPPELVCDPECHLCMECDSPPCDDADPCSDGWIECDPTPSNPKIKIIVRAGNGYMNLFPGPANPDKKMEVVPPEGKVVDVLQLRVSSYPVPGWDVTIDSMEFDFTGNGNPSDVMEAYLYRSNDPDDSGTLVRTVPGSQKMRFENLDDNIPYGVSRYYTLKYALEKTDPTCKEYGASITPAQIGASTGSGTGDIDITGLDVRGSVVKKGPPPAVTIDPAGAGWVELRPPDLECYEEITLEAFRSPGYVFDHWSGDLSGNQNPAVLPIDSAKTVTAHYRRQPPSNSKFHGKVLDPVNTATGEFYFNLPLFDLGGPLPLNFSLYYGSAVSGRIGTENPFSHIMGPNWLHNFEMVREYISDTRTSFILEKGKIIEFVLSGGKWVATSNEEIPYVLKTDDQGNYYLMDPADDIVYMFDNTRRLAWIQDRNGNRLTMSYDDGGHLTRVADRLGRTVNLTYSEDRLIGADDGNGRSYAFGYTDGLLTSIQDPMGNITRFEYSETGTGLIARVVYPKGNSHYTQTYDTQGRVVKQTDGSGNNLEISFGENGDTAITHPDGATFGHTHMSETLLTDYRDPSGKTVAMTYDAHNRRTSLTDRAGATTSAAYHQASGTPSSITDARGSTTSYTYTPHEQALGPVTFTFHDITRIDYPDGTHEEYTYDEKGNIVTRKDRLGQTYTMTYNDMGLCLTVELPSGGKIIQTYNDDGTIATYKSSDTDITRYEYDRFKRLVKTIHPDGSYTALEYDLNNRLTRRTDEKGNSTTCEYDENGNLVSVTDAAGNTTTYEYDGMGRLTRSISPLGYVTEMSYDSMGRLTVITNGNGNRAAFQYDSEGRLVERSEGGGSPWHIDYDDEGVVRAITSPLGHTTRYETDSTGQIIKTTNAEGNSWEFKRDALNRVTGIRDPLGNEITFLYDQSGLVTEIERPVTGRFRYERNSLGLAEKLIDYNGNEWSFTYTLTGKVKTFKDPLENTWTYDYDQSGRLVKTWFPDGATLDIEYDAAGNIVSRQYSDGTRIDYTSDSLNRLTSANNIAVTYDAEGRAVTTQNFDGTVFGAAYDAGQRVKSVIYADDLTVIYEYNESEQLTKVSDSLTNSWVRFSYDDDGRLTRMSRSNGIDTEFSYDWADRITGIRDGDIADQHYRYDAASRVIASTLDLPLNDANLTFPEEQRLSYNEASEVSSFGYTYDKRGNQTQTPFNAYTWDAAGALIDTGWAHLEYNGMGDLIRRTAGGKTTDFYYNYAIGNTPIVAEKDESSSRFKRYYVWAPGGTLLYALDGSSPNDVSFYHFDLLGSTLFLTDGYGNMTDAYAYSPYGILMIHEGTSDQPFLFMGRDGVRQEGQSGLYQMGARYYDARTACFISRDPEWLTGSFGGGVNPYLYADNNPLKYTDPDGTGTKKWIENMAKWAKEALAKRSGKLNVRGKTGSLAGKIDKSEKDGASWYKKAAYFMWSGLPGSKEIEKSAKAVNEQASKTGWTPSLIDKIDGESIGGGMFRDIAGTPTTLLRVATDLSMEYSAGPYARNAIKKFWLLWWKQFNGKALTDQEKEFMAMFRKTFGQSSGMEEFRLGLGATVVGMGELAISGTEHIEEGMTRAYAWAVSNWGNPIAGGIYNMTDPVLNSRQILKNRKSKNPLVRWGAALGDSWAGSAAAWVIYKLRY